MVRPVEPLLAAPFLKPDKASSRIPPLEEKSLLLRTASLAQVFLLLLAAGIVQRGARAQTVESPGQTVTTGRLGSESFPPPVENYHPLTQKERFHRYTGWMFSPYSMASVTFVSGIQQAERNPPDWEEGWAGYGERYASNLGTEMTNATARFALADLLHEDTLYYRCQCSGFWPRFRHAVFSTFIARRGADGHQAFGLPELIAPYAGPIVSVYGWYPDRFGIEDALRMGNHGILSEAGTNVAIEFLPSILHRRGRRWEKRLHLGIPSGASAAH